MWIRAVPLPFFDKWVFTRSPHMCRLTKTPPFRHSSDLRSRLHPPSHLPHTCLTYAVGCILGFAFVYAGSGGVLWYVPDPTSFPPYKGLVPIVVAWFFSPIFTAIASAIIFSFLKFTFLRRTWGWKASIWSLPVFVFGVFLCCIYFVFTKVTLCLNPHENCSMYHVYNVLPSSHHSLNDSC